MKSKKKNLGFTLFLFSFFLWGNLEGEKSLLAQKLQHHWTQKFYDQLNGELALLYANEMPLAKLAFGDIDGDGDQDLFQGMKNGRLAFFENQGTLGFPDFILKTQDYKAVFVKKERKKNKKVRKIIDVGDRSAPTLVDIDNDGDLDLLMGSKKGELWFFKNQGNNLLPEFEFQTQNYHNLKLGENTVPKYADVNLDRRYDIVIGNGAGDVFLVINEGTRRKDLFSSDPPSVAKINQGHNASPSLNDWDDDGDLDLIVGRQDGTLSYFVNEGDRFFPQWKFQKDHFEFLDLGGDSAPSLTDLDQDGDLDVLFGTSNNHVVQFENRKIEEKRTLWNGSQNYLRFEKLIVAGERASSAVGDVDDDGDFDLIVGEKAGNLNYYVNDGTREQANLILKTENLTPISGVFNSAPVLADLDGDNDLDLLIGRQSGQLVFVENQGTPKKPKWIVREKTYFNIDVGSNSVPRLVDVDQDKDLDLLVGNYSGRVILYVNQGTVNEPKFVLSSARYGSVNTEQDAVPAFFDYNEDQALDIVVGKVDGTLLLSVSPGLETQFDTQWEVKKTWTAYDLTSLSHPLFYDFQGSEHVDLFIGNRNGDFNLFIHDSLERVKEQETRNQVSNSIDKSELGAVEVQDVQGDSANDGALFTLEKPPVSTTVTEENTVPEEELEPERIIVDPVFIQKGEILIQESLIQRSTPTFGDLDGDGDLDLMVGSSMGKIYYFENQGNVSKWDFIMSSEPEVVETGSMKNTTPNLVDLDDDDDLDLVVGDALGRLHYFENQGDSIQFNFVQNPDLFRHSRVGLNAAPTIVDIDGDGALDILAGNLRGKLVYLRQKKGESFAQNSFEIVRRDYLSLDVGVGSAPFLADLNNDGEQELLIGTDNGKVLFLKQDSGNVEWGWSEISKYGQKLSFGQGAFPAAFDLDHDGDMDLVMGSESGVIFFYRNDAILEE